MGESKQKLKKQKEAAMKYKKEAEDAKRKDKKNAIVFEENVSVSAMLKKNKFQNQINGTNKKNVASPKGRRKGTNRRKKKNAVFAELNGDANDADNELADRLRQRKE